MESPDALSDARLEASVATAGLSPDAPATWRLYLAAFVASRGGERPEDLHELHAIQARIRALAEAQVTPQA